MIDTKNPAKKSKVGRIIEALNREDARANRTSRIQQIIESRNAKENTKLIESKNATKKARALREAFDLETYVFDGVTAPEVELATLIDPEVAAFYEWEPKAEDLDASWLTEDHRVVNNEDIIFICAVVSDNDALWDNGYGELCLGYDESAGRYILFNIYGAPDWWVEEVAETDILAAAE